MFLGGKFPVSGATVEESRLLVIPAEPFRRALGGTTALCSKMMASWRSISAVSSSRSVTRCARVHGRTGVSCSRLARSGVGRLVHLPS